MKAQERPLDEYKFTVEVDGIEVKSNIIVDKKVIDTAIDISKAHPDQITHLKFKGKLWRTLVNGIITERKSITINWN